MAARVHFPNFILGQKKWNLLQNEIGDEVNKVATRKNEKKKARIWSVLINVTLLFLI